MFCVVGVFPPLSFRGVRPGLGPLPPLRELLTVEQRCDLRTRIYERQVSLVQVMVGRWSVLLAWCSDHLIAPATAFTAQAFPNGSIRDYGDTSDTVTLRRCSPRPTVRSLQTGVTARRFWRQIGCPKLVRANAMDIARGGGGRAGKRAGNGSLLPLHAEATVSHFSVFFWLR